MLHAVKGKNYDLGGLDSEKILKYEDVLNDCLKEYFLPPEATKVSPIIPFSPMPGGALTANTQMMRDNNILHKFPEVIKAMREVVKKGGFGTSVTPVSQFYFQQAFNNVMFGKWNKIAEGYGKMVLGYFGKTPVKADEKIIELASKQLGLEPTTRAAIDIADEDSTKSIAYAKKILEHANIETTEENIFIALACKEKGIAYLKGEAKVNVRKGKFEPKPAKQGDYTIIVNGEKYNVQITKGHNQDLNIKNIEKLNSGKSHKKEEKRQTSNKDIISEISANVYKVLVKNGETVKKNQPIVVLEAMKMEIEVNAPSDGVIKEVFVKVGGNVESGDIIASLE